jgi:hypothetical protein
VAEALGALGALEAPEEDVASLVALLEDVELTGVDTGKLCQSRNSERKLRKRRYRPLEHVSF